jgi:hypothetical protein
MTENSVRILVALLVVGLVLAVSGLAPGPAAAAFVQVHGARQNFYSTGGTAVSSCVGEACASSAWTVGDTSGSVQWHIIEKVFKDTATSQTRFQYSVTNDLFASAITGLKVWDDGVLASSWTLPANWTMTQDTTWWNPLTSVGSAGINAGLTKTLTLTVNQLVPLVFVNSTGVDFLTGCGTPPCLTSKLNWSTISAGPLVVTPEPGTLALLGAGLAAAGLGLRKRLRRRTRGRSAGLLQPPPVQHRA